MPGFQHDAAALRAAWAGLVRSRAIPARAAEEAFTDLLRRYSEPHRRYHGPGHLAEVLGVIDRLGDLADDLCSVRLAAWFHDAVYDPRAGDNEERSAAYAGEVLGRWRFPPKGIEKVRGLVLKTKAHRTGADDRDGHVLLDADLAILGESEDRYDEYARAIREEYAWIPEGRYREGRRKVLRAFLRRPRIYRTAPLFAERETRARRNLRREADSLARDK
jgi:predicted metal-dependent HD superfamily phosphohydrolase